MSTPPPVWPPQPGVPSPYGSPQSNSNATLILVLGIMSLVGFAILGPVAWILGNNALKTGMMDQSQVGQVNTGRICGIIGTVILALAIVGYIVFFSVFAAAVHTAPHSSSFPTPMPGH